MSPERKGTKGGRHSDAGELLRGHSASFMGEGNVVNVETRCSRVVVLGAAEWLVSCYMNFASERETRAL